jgi:hypothetical protein
MSTTAPTPPTIHRVRSHRGRAAGATLALAAAAACTIALAVSGGSDVRPASQDEPIVRPGTSQAAPAAKPAASERIRSAAERFHHRR